ncbi:MAG: hypothetical protein WCJ51_03600 [Candidatus Moraniibacteriota bacterium]
MKYETVGFVDVTPSDPKFLQWASEVFKFHTSPSQRCSEVGKMTVSDKLAKGFPENFLQEDSSSHSKRLYYGKIVHSTPEREIHEKLGQISFYDMLFLLWRGKLSKKYRNIFYVKDVFGIAYHIIWIWHPDTQLYGWWVLVGDFSSSTFSGSAKCLFFSEKNLKN